MRVATFSLLVFLLALSGCNTVRGLGQDLESAADAGEEVI